MDQPPFPPEDPRLRVIVVPSETAGGSTVDWRRDVPVLDSGKVTLRELREGDAASLFAMVATPEVSRFISPPPSNLAGFARFIAWSHREREAGNYLCLGVVPRGYDTAIGVIQLRQLEPGFRTAEWGFALGSAFWGSGVFVHAAGLTLKLAFDIIGIHRLEARSVVGNTRGNGALRKIGAVPEGVLRKSFLKDGEWLDQMLYSLIESDWRKRMEVVTSDDWLN